MLDVQVGDPGQPGDELPRLGQGAAAHRQRAPNIQPQDVFACRDGDVVLVVGNDGQFAKLCEVLGRPEWVTRRALRHATRRACATSALLDPLMRAAGSGGSATRDWIAPLDAAGVPCSPRHRDRRHS